MERRRFIRHPLSYPLKTKLLGPSGEAVGVEFTSRSEDIGAGGLLFQSERSIPVGTRVEVELRVERRTFSLEGKVVRSEPLREEPAGDGPPPSGRHAVAVAFFSPSDLLKVRMMEQIVRIEIFKNRLERRYKVELDFAAVAKEWIRRYSKAFAEHYSL